MTLEKPMVTWTSAMEVLAALCNVEKIRQVYVVGSVAREWRGNDLDVVLVVDTFTYINFLRKMWAVGDSMTDYYANFREQRIKAAVAVIKMSPTEYGWVSLAIRQLGAHVDIHVMPEGWMQNIDEVQTHLPHNDPQFVANIAGDAKRVWTI